MFGIGKKKTAVTQEAGSMAFEENDKYFQEFLKMPPWNVTDKTTSSVSRMPQAIQDHYQSFKLKSKDDELVMA